MSIRFIVSSELASNPICLNGPIIPVGDRFHTATPSPFIRRPPHPPPPTPPGLPLVTLNIRYGRESWLEQAIREVQIGSFDLMILTATKVSDQYYCCNILGYEMVCLPMSTTVDGGAHRVVCLVIQERHQGWSLEATRFHRLNMVSCEVVTNKKRSSVIGVNHSPSTLEHVPDLEEDLNHFWYKDTMFLGELRANINQAQNPRRHQVADLLIKFGLIDLLHYL